MESAVRSFLIWRIFTSTLEQAALTAIVLWGLPGIGVDLPTWLLVPTSIALAIWNVYTYRKAAQALRVPPVAGLTDMEGSRGEVVGRLHPAGHIRIRGELWSAESESGELGRGDKVVVVRQDGLKLTVREVGRGGVQGDQGMRPDER